MFTSLLLTLLLFSRGVVFGTVSGSQCTSNATEIITATIYADNWFTFWFNGELIMEDPIEFIPHQAVEFSFEAPVCGPRVFAIEAKDYSNNVTALEYDDNCVGDGGLKAMFSDGTVTSDSWQCKTTFYGPTNPEECIPNYDPAIHFTPLLCKFNTNETLKGRSCVAESYSYSDQWMDVDFDTAAHDGWSAAVEFNDSVVGWGVPPSDCVALLCPAALDWSTYGTLASFIWRDHLNFDNTVLCRYEYFMTEPTGSPTEAPELVSTEQFYTSTIATTDQDDDESNALQCADRKSVV